MFLHQSIQYVSKRCNPKSLIRAHMNAFDMPNVQTQTRFFSRKRPSTISMLKKILPVEPIKEVQTNFEWIPPSNKDFAAGAIVNEEEIDEESLADGDYSELHVEQDADLSRARAKKAREWVLDVSTLLDKETAMIKVIEGQDLTVEEIEAALNAHSAIDTLLIRKENCKDPHYDVIIATCTSRRHMLKLANMIRDSLRARRLSKGVIRKADALRFSETSAENWMAFELGSVVLHLFDEKTRLRYDLESRYTKGVEDLQLKELEDEILEAQKKQKK